jgi:hypothetical protein
LCKNLLLSWYKSFLVVYKSCIFWKRQAVERERRHTTTAEIRRGAELNKSAEKKCKKAKECEIDMAAVVSFPLFSDW